MCVCVHKDACMAYRVSTSVHGGQKKALNPLEVELQVAVSYPIPDMGVSNQIPVFCKRSVCS